MRRILYIFLLSTVTLGFSQTDSIKALLDLRSVDFKHHAPIDLNTNWEFVSGQFVEPSSYSTYEFEYVDVPKRWDQLGYDAYGFGTYHLNVLVDTQEYLTIKIPDLFSSYHFYINGVLLETAGEIGKIKDNYSPKRVVRYVDIPHTLVSTGHLDIIIQIANFDHSKGGFGSPLKIGSRKIISDQKFNDDSYDLFLTGALVMGSLFFLGLYFYGRKEYMTLYFALFSQVYAYRVAGWGNYVLHDLIDLPYHFAIRVEYVTFYLAGFFFSRYLINLFPQETPKALAQFFSYSSILWSLSVFLPVYYFSQLNTYYLYILLIGLGTVAFVFIKAAINRKPGAALAIYSTIGVFTIFIMKTLAYLNIVTEVKAVSIMGEMCFFFFQALILSKYFISTWVEAKMEAEQVAKTKADFLSIMSHEIRTPLNALIGTTYHMLDAQPRKDQKEDLKNMKNASENLLNLVNNILDFNKIEQNKLELELSNVKLKGYLKSQVKVFKSNAEKKGIYLDFNYDSRLPRIVRMDKGRVGQILNNLIGNAIKFTKEGGVTLNISEDVTTTNMVNIKFEVIDTGIGIDETEREKVFASFEQANTKITGKYGGTGLGLAISKKLVQHMGSDIELDSSPGMGSKFYFSLELEPIALETETKEVQEELKLDDTYLLLVEDNAMNVMIAKRFLNKWNVQVDVAENGEIAVKMAQDHQYDMILMDLQMPVMNGYDAAKAIRINGYKNPILALTASAISESELKENGSLMDDYITKPYKPEDLYYKIKSNLREKSEGKAISTV